MTARRLVLRIDAAGLGTCELDGEDISSKVSGVSLSSSVHELTIATLHLTAVDVDADVEAEVVLPAPLRRALIAQGWTPPAEPDERDAAAQAEKALDAAPGVYQLPAEPPPSVTELWTASGLRATRCGQHLGCWLLAPGSPLSHYSFMEMLTYDGPLSTTPPAGTEARDAG